MLFCLMNWKTTDQSKLPQNIHRGFQGVRHTWQLKCNSKVIHIEVPGLQYPFCTKEFGEGSASPINNLSEGEA